MVGSQSRTCCIVGGGPAGLILGLILARAGVAVTVLEKHQDFLRDFRGDTVHASTLTLLDELGLGQEFAAVDGVRYLESMTAQLDGGAIRVGDLARLPGPHKHIALVPQWDFLDVVADASRREASYELIMGAEVIGLLRRDGLLAGVRYRRAGQDHELAADLVVGSDGRTSTVRRAAGLEPREFGVPLDVEWFRLPRRNDDPGDGIGRFSRNTMFVLIDRGSYFQIGCLIKKGADADLRAAGIAAFRDRIATVVPWLADRVAELGSFDDVKLLSVRLSRLRRWFGDGLLLIGDAAHAMSPVGGVGINLAVQDAVAAARILGPPLRAGRLKRHHLILVQARRWLPTVVTQGGQRLVHRIFRRLPSDPTAPADDSNRPLPLPLRLLQKVPVLRAVPAYVVAIGVLPEHAPRWARREAGSRTPDRGPGVSRADR